MRLGNILTKKFLISFVCVLFTAIISLCGANLVNTYLMDTTSGYQETVTDDDESSGNGEENVQAEAEGYWSDNASRPEGTGSSSNPYVIEDASDLAYILEEPDKHYVFSNSCTSIDMSAHYWDASNTVFESGSLIGPDSGVTIYNIVLPPGILWVNPTYYFLPEIQENYIVSNLIIDVTNGGFIGIAVDSTISNITVISSNTQTEKAIFQSKVYVAGGIVSEAENVIIQNCINMADISISGSSPIYAGGIVGRIMGGENNIIENCVNYGNISGFSRIGGIVGQVDLAYAFFKDNSLTISRCINYGNLSSSFYVAGIVGAVTKGNIINIQFCISAMSESGLTTTRNQRVNDYRAGIIGYIDASASTICIIENCAYASRYGSLDYHGDIERGMLEASNISEIRVSGDILSKGTVLNYMQTYNYSCGNGLSKVWTTSTVYSYGYNNFSSEMVTLSSFVVGFNLAIQNEVQTGINQYEYQLVNDSNGYQVYLTDNGEEIYLNNNSLNACYITKNPHSQVIFTVVEPNTKGIYNFLGIFDGTDVNTSHQIGSNLNYITVPLNLSGDYVIRCGLIKETYSFSAAYCDEIINPSWFESLWRSYDLTEGTKGGYISSYRVDMRDSNGDRRSEGTTNENDISSSSIPFENNSYLTSITFEIKLEEGFEFYGLFRKSALGGSNNLHIYANQNVANSNSFILGNLGSSSSSLTSTSGTDSNIYFTLKLYETPSLNEFDYVFVFRRYQYKIDINIDIYEVTDVSKIESKKLSGYYGYNERKYHRSVSIFKDDYFGIGGDSDIADSTITIVSNSDHGGYLDGEYNWYLGYIETDELGIGNNGDFALCWGGIQAFSFTDTDYLKCKNSEDPNSRSLTLNLSALFGTNSKGNLNLTTNNTINITLKKFVVDPDEDYLNKNVDADGDGIDDSVGGKYVTYSFYVLDVYDSSVETGVNNYVFGSNGGITSLSKLTSINENQYYSVNVTHVNNLAVTNNNGELEVTSDGSISGYRIDFTLFLFYDFNFVNFDEGDPLSKSGWADTLGRKDNSNDEKTGGNIKLSDIVSITKNPVNGYYYNGSTVNYFQVHNSNFNSSISIDNLNSSLKDLSNAGNDLYTLANGASSNTKVYLLSYYSLTTFTLNINIASSGSIRSFNYALLINDEMIFDNLNGTGNSSSDSSNTFTNIKSYSKIEIKTNQIVTFTSGNAITYYKFDGIYLNGVKASDLPNFTFQLSSNPDINTEVSIQMAYEEVQSNISYLALERDKNGYYLISSPEDLFAILYTFNRESEDFEGYKFKQTCDIDMSGYNFLPIGSEYIPFRGSYDGQYYSIYNLKIDAGNLSNVGLFGYVENATIKNLNFVGGSITGFNNVGVIGYAENSTITRVNNYSCTINSSDDIITNHIFMVDDETLDEPYTDSNGNGQYDEREPYEDINGNDKYGKYNIVKALTSETGYNENLLLRVRAETNGAFNDFTFSVGGTDSYAFSTVSSAYNVGGLLGNVTGSSVSVSSSKGTVEQETADITEGTDSDVSADDSAVESVSDKITNRNIAGFVGYVSGGTISNCYTSQATFAGTTENSSLTCCHKGISDVTELTDCDCESKFNW